MLTLEEGLASVSETIARRLESSESPLAARSAVFSFLTAQLTDGVPNGAPDRAQMPNRAKGATAGSGAVNAFHTPS